jgi:hypothetical protein
MMTLLRFMIFIWSLCSLIRVHVLTYILDILYQTMLFHIFNKTWLSIWDILRICSNWNGTWRLSNGSIFNF